MKLSLFALLLLCVSQVGSTPLPKREKRQYGEGSIPEDTLPSETVPEVVAETTLAPEIIDVTTLASAVAVEELETTQAPVTVNEIEVATTMVPETVNKVVPQIVSEVTEHPEVLSTVETYTVTHVEPATTLVVETVERVVPQTTVVSHVVEVPEVQTSVVPVPAENLSVVAPAVPPATTDNLETLRQANRVRAQKIVEAYLKTLEYAAEQQARVQAQNELMQAQVQQNIENARKGIYTPVTLTPPVAPINISGAQPVPPVAAIQLPQFPTIATPQFPTIATPQLPTVPLTIEEIQAQANALQQKAFADAQRIMEENRKAVDNFQAQQRAYLASLNLPNVGIAPGSFGPSPPIVPTAADAAPATTSSSPSATTENLLSRMKREADENTKKLTDLLTPAKAQPVASSPAPVLAVSTNQPVTPVPVTFKTISLEELMAANKAKIEDQQAKLQQNVAKIQADLNAAWAKLIPPTTVAPVKA